MKIRFIPQDYINKAVLFKLFLIAQETSDWVSDDYIASKFDFDLSGKRVSLAYTNLHNRKFVIGSVDEVTITDKGYTYVEAQLQEYNSFLSEYASNGDNWLEQQAFKVGGIPASDRIVNKSDNLPVIEEVINSLNEIETQLDEDNEVGAALGDDKALFKAEIEASKNLAKNDRFRLKSLISLILPALKFLSEKFASSAIGELSKKLITLIIDGL